MFWWARALSRKNKSAIGVLAGSRILNEWQLEGSVHCRERWRCFASGQFIAASSRVGQRITVGAAPVEFRSNSANPVMPLLNALTAHTSFGPQKIYLRKAPS